MIEIGKILTTHGLDGAVKLQSFCENPEDIFNYNLFIFNNQPISCKKVGLTSKKDVFLAKFENISSIDEAKKYRNTILFTKEDDLDNDSMMYINDLINMSVISNGKVGKITEFSNYGAGDIIDIEWEDGKKESILFNKNIVNSVDKDKNIINIKTPEYI